MQNDAGFFFGGHMNIEARLRSLRTSSRITTGFSILLVVTGLVQIGLGVVAVNGEYGRIAELEELTRPSQYYGYQAQQAALDAEYTRSSSAFFYEGRFIPATDGLALGDPAVIASLVLLFTGIGFIIAAMVWVWRAHANLIDAGVRAKFGPGKAVAAYLIPGVNLILPFEAMRELYNRSHGEPEDFAHSSVEDVTAWWTSVVVGLLIFSAMIVKFILDIGSSLVIMTPIWMEFAIIAFALVLLLFGAFLFAGLTRKITAAQRAFLSEIAGTIQKQEPPKRMMVNVVQA